MTQPATLLRNVSCMTRTVMTFFPNATNTTGLAGSMLGLSRAEHRRHASTPHGRECHLQHADDGLELRAGRRGRMFLWNDRRIPNRVTIKVHAIICRCGGSMIGGTVPCREPDRIAGFGRSSWSLAGRPTVTADTGAASTLAAVYRYCRHRHGGGAFYDEKVSRCAAGHAARHELKRLTRSCTTRCA